MRRHDLIGILLLLAACGGSGGERGEDGTEVSIPPAAEPEPDTISAGCRLEAGSEALLFGNGRILAVHVEEGDSVSAGQVLVSLSSDAVVEGAVSSGAREAEAARIAAENAGLDYRRCLSLYEAGAISEMELEGARTAMEAAEAALAAARAGLSGAVSGRNASVVQAPFDGVVGRVWAGEGSMAGSEPLLMVTDGSGFVARVLLPEYRIGSIQPGSDAWFETSALPGERFAGIVTSVSPGIDPVTSLLPLTVSIEDHGNLLVPGLYGMVGIASCRQAPVECGRCSWNSSSGLPSRSLGSRISRIESGLAQGLVDIFRSCGQGFLPDHAAFSCRPATDPSGALSQVSRSSRLFHATGAPPPGNRVIPGALAIAWLDPSVQPAYSCHGVIQEGGSAMAGCLPALPVACCLALVIAGPSPAQTDGSIVAWGMNSYGQCNVPAPNSGFIAIAADYYHSMGLRSDGSVAVWGSNDSLQCVVPAPNQDFIDVAAGRFFCVGLKGDGSVVAWGSNCWSQCMPPSPNSGFVDIAAGAFHVVGLKEDSTIVCWGSNQLGQCDVPSPNQDFVGISAGSNHSLGLKADGSIVCWGYNSSGQCNVPSPNTEFIDLGGDYAHSIGLKSDGSIVCWGWNGFGQCTVPAPNAGFISVDSGFYNSLGLKSTGSIVCWGDNSFGQCTVPSPNTDFIDVAGGYGHCLGLHLLVVSSEDPFDRVENPLQIAGASPDPFSTVTNVAFQTQGAGFVQVRVFDVCGREVFRDEIEGGPSGAQICGWNGSSSSGVSLSNGVYLIVLTQGSSNDAVRVVLLR